MTSYRIRSEADVIKFQACIEVTQMNVANGLRSTRLVHAVACDDLCSSVPLACWGGGGYRSGGTCPSVVDFENGMAR